MDMVGSSIYRYIHRIKWLSLVFGVYVCHLYGIFMIAFNGYGTSIIGIWYPWQ